MNKLEKEVMDAYADCHLDWETGAKIRNLSFRASESCNKEVCKELLKKYIPHGYNDFDYNLIDKFDDKNEFIIAREGSVCLYVTGPNLPSSKDVKADEKNKENGWTRYWWD